MRFLFVYQDFAAGARQLIGELNVSDVRIIVVRKGQHSPNAEELALIRTNPEAPAAACGLDRKYRKAVSDLVTFNCEPKVFRLEDRQLRDWLVPPHSLEIGPPPLPSESFLEAARNPNLLLCKDALSRADELPSHRRKFAKAAAELLSRYANGELLGVPRDWKSQYGVASATGGRVMHRYEVTLNGAIHKGTSDHHLKEGDHTTSEAAARVYFHRFKVNDETRVIVFYVGPHPAYATYRVSWPPT
jgi:hypothetical protein